MQQVAKQETTSEKTKTTTYGDRHEELSRSNRGSEGGNTQGQLIKIKQELRLNLTEKPKPHRVLAGCESYLLPTVSFMVATKFLKKGNVLQDLPQKQTEVSQEYLLDCCNSKWCLDDES